MSAVGGGAVLSDWDGTLRRGFAVIDWLAYLASRGLVDAEHVASIRRLVDRFERTELSYDEFAKKVVERYGVAMRGLNVRDLRSEARLFNEQDQGLFDFAVPLLFRIVPRYDLVIISGAPTELLEDFFHWTPSVVVHGLRLIFDDRGVATGRVVENVALHGVKEKVVRLHVGSKVAVAALGDTEADRALFDAAAVAIAVGNRIESNADSRWIYLDRYAGRSGAAIANVIMEKIEGSR